MATLKDKTLLIAAGSAESDSDLRVRSRVDLRAVALVALVVLLAPGSDRKVLGRDGGDWPHYGGDPGAMRSSPLRQITPENVARLRTAWTYHIGERQRLPNISPDPMPPAFQSTPVIVNGAMYFVTPSSRVIALAADTGRELWQFDPQAGTSQRGFHQHRGLAYWSGRSRDEPRECLFYGTLYGDLICLSTATGKPCSGFGAGGRVNLRAGAAAEWPKALYAVTSPPSVYQNLVIIGARLQERPSQGPGGVVRAFDARTGREVWQFHSVPRPGEAGHETWEGTSWKDRSGVNAWSMSSVDVERGLVFVPFGGPATDFYGGDRKGRNLFGNTLVALDARTGKLRWSYQMVHHDLWDYDLPAQPLLATVSRNGRAVPVVVQVTKMGLVFVLDRTNGRPIFDIEERKVPSSTIPGEAAWPTQPFPVRPPPLVRHTIARQDLSTVTPASAEQCRELFDSVPDGRRIYTPIGTGLTLMVPGTLGGANWSGAAFSPRTRLLYVNVNELPLVVAFAVQSDGVPRIRHYKRFVDANGWPCVKPPWGSLAAIDLATGEIAWQKPLGTVDRLTEAGVPPTGVPNLGGAIVTDGGLVFIAGTVDRRIRAFDARTGQQLWEAPLEASGHATPATYADPRTGRQFVVVAAGGGGYLSPDDVSDAVVAFALP